MTTQPVPPNLPRRVLVASPSGAARQRVFESLRTPVHDFEQAEGGAEALDRLESGCWQKLYLDRRLPDLDAEELRETVRQRFPEVEVVLMDPVSDLGSDSVPYGDVDQETKLIEHSWTSMLQRERSDEDAPRGQGIAMAPLPGMIGTAPSMQPVYRLARLVAPRNTAVLITGPTGCGKEMVARAIHQLSPRSAKPFVVVNCAAIPETLLEAELFGYARGAFTGAMQSYAGRIQAAQGGTIFLDEIGEMPLSLQPKLLRFLEQKEMQRLGSAEVVRVDARVVSATNAHLLTLVREGKFREDLYYRLCGFPIEIPPLEDRREDIESLAKHFLERFMTGARVPQFSPKTLHVLKSHFWPGNIRELQNVIERAAILCEEGTVIRPEHVPLADPRAGSSR